MQYFAVQKKGLLKLSPEWGARTKALLTCNPMTRKGLGCAGFLRRLQLAALGERIGIMKREAQSSTFMARRGPLRGICGFAQGNVRSPGYCLLQNLSRSLQSIPRVMLPQKSKHHSLKSHGLFVLFSIGHTPRLSSLLLLFRYLVSSTNAIGSGTIAQLEWHLIEAGVETNVAGMVSSAFFYFCDACSGSSEESSLFSLRETRARLF